MAAHTLEQRPIGALGRMTIVAGIHLAVFYFIAKGMGVMPSLGILETEPVVPIDIPRPVEKVPIPPVIIEQPKSYVPEPVVKIETPMEPPITVEMKPIEEIPIDPPRGSAVTEVPGTSVMQDSRYPLSQPDYPPASKRDGEAGAADVDVYVLANGRVGDVRISRTTGYERLDNAAILEARRSWRFKPATRAGEAVAQWYKVRVVFKLTDQK
jgi:protein TonB